MKMILEDNEVEEILISDIVKSDDRGLVIEKGKTGPKNEKHHEEIKKEIAAIDSLTMSQIEAGRINGITQSGVSGYINGRNVDEETRNNILSIKHKIADKAITKLMDTLDLFNPNGIEKQVDIARAAGQIAGIVERISGKSSSDNSIHLHLHAPRMRTLDSYKVIDV
jgi:predicted transcriptional regulator